jgi:hypothetical protein
MARERIFCDCGGELSHPVPPVCPHCGGRIVRVRRRWWTIVAPLILILALLAALCAFVWWMAAP